jgi:pimeloyl-ACP methyl ester carboxylesterase
LHSLPLPEWNTVIRWCALPGEGVPILCLPGLSFAAIPNFLPMMTRPQFRGRPVLMVDFLGSGLSGHPERFGYSLDEHARSIAAVVEAACAGPVHLLGYSMGGTVAIALALARPDLVSRLVVCEANLTPGGGEASRRIAVSDPERFVSVEYHESRKRLAEKAALGSDFCGFLWAARSGADPRGLHANARMLVGLPEVFAAQFLALPLERHFVYGEKTFPGTTGVVAPDAPGPDLLKAGGVGVHVVPGVGHGLMIDDPAACADVLGPLL